MLSALLYTSPVSLKVTHSKRQKLCFHSYPLLSL